MTANGRRAKPRTLPAVAHTHLDQLVQVELAHQRASSTGLDFQVAMVGILVLELHLSLDRGAELVGIRPVLQAPAEG